jgi:hypothetical protein
VKLSRFYQFVESINQFLIEFPVLENLHHEAAAALCSWLDRAFQILANKHIIGVLKIFTKSLWLGALQAFLG